MRNLVIMNLKCREIKSNIIKIEKLMKEKNFQRKVEKI